MKKIEVVITPEGKIVVETKGYKGKECLDASKALEHLLGEISDLKLTQEYYQQEVGMEVVKQEQ